MRGNKHIAHGFGFAFGQLAYIAAVVWFMTHAERLFDGAPEFLAAFVMLLLFVISATVTGLLVLGRPAYLYLGGQKREAVALLISTVAWLAIFLVVLLTAWTVNWTAK